MESKNKEKILDIVNRMGNLEELEEDTYLFRWGGKDVKNLDIRFNVKDFPCIISFGENEELQINVFLFLDEKVNVEVISPIVNEINANNSTFKAFIDNDSDVNMIATIGIQGVEHLENTKTLESLIETTIVILMLYSLKIKLVIVQENDEEK